MNLQNAWFMSHTSSIIFTALFLVSALLAPSVSVMFYRMAFFSLLSAYTIVLFESYRSSFSLTLDFFYRRLNQDETFWYFLLCLYFSGSGDAPVTILLCTLESYSVFHVANFLLSYNGNSSGAEQSSLDRGVSILATSIKSAIPASYWEKAKAMVAVPEVRSQFMLKAAGFEVMTLFMLMITAVFTGKASLLSVLLYGNFLYNRFLLSPAMKFVVAEYQNQVNGVKASVKNSSACPTFIKNYL